MHLWNSTAVRVQKTYFAKDDLLTRAEGVRVEDRAGRSYLDARSGFWNVTLGYSNQAVVTAIQDQVARLPYASLYGYGRPGQIAIDAAAVIADRLPPDFNHVKFHSGGAQAVESAVLLSRHTRLLEGTPDRNVVVALWGGFHGFGPGASQLTGLEYLHFATGPLLPEIVHMPAPIGNGEEAVAFLDTLGPNTVTALVCEPIIGEGGYVLTQTVLQRLREYCTRHGIHLIMDEVTTGWGRTGDWTRSAQLGISPDIITLGKGLTSGYVGLSAVCPADHVYTTVVEGPEDHFFASGSTHDGHPLALASAIAVVDELADGTVFDNVSARSRQLHDALQDVARQHDQVSAVRGDGLMYAVELANTTDEIFANKVRLAMESRGVLVSVLNAVPALMIIPPLIVSESDIAEIALALDDSLQDLTTGRWVPDNPMKGFV